MLNRHEDCGGGNKCNLDNAGKMTTYYCYSTYHQKYRKFLSCFPRIQTCFYDCISFFILFIHVIYSRGLSFILSVIYVILYSSANVPLNKPYIRKSPNEKNNPFVSNCYKFDIKRVTALDSVIMFPVNSQNMNKKTFVPLPSSHGVNTSELATHHSTCNSESNYLALLLIVTVSMIIILVY